MTRFEKLFQELDTECALITSDVNRRYFTGMKSSDGLVLAFPEKAYLLIDFRYIEKARNTVTSAEVIELKKLQPQMSELLKKHGVSKVSVESDTMTIRQLNSYKHTFREVTFDDSNALSDAVKKLRMTKDDEEISYIRKAQEIAETAFEELLRFIRAGVTEREITLELNRLMFFYGAEDLSFETIALAGANTSMPHGVPSDKKVGEGEFVLLDFGAVWNGYHSDMTRTVCVGKPSEEMEKVYNIVLEAQLAALEAARAGITGRELDRISRDIIEKAGYGEYFGHSLGHGVGQEIHEYPTLSPKKSQTLKNGMVFTIEPGVYIDGKFGIRIEDTVVLENGKVKRLYTDDKKLLILKLDIFYHAF